MQLINHLTIVFVLLSFDTSPVSANMVTRSIKRIHVAAVRHTHGFARDLRLAFGGVLVTQPSPSRVVYCKPGRQIPLGTGGGSSGNVTSTSARSGPSTTKSSTSSSSKPTGSSTPSSPWKLTESHQGQDFFNGWSFSTGGDPTHGIVQYVDESTARSNNLLEINSAGNAIMRVETTPSVQNTRQSVRITTESSFNGGLIIMDSIHMPTGCGTWPAFWTNGPDWPAGGEIDIVEGVHDYTNNQATIHTNPGCTIATSSSNALKISGNVIGGTDCAALTTGNQGCGIRASSSNSFGAAFNANGGGVYAMQWDASGIAVFFFPRGSEPADITTEAPRPDTWGPAMARWPAASCDPFKFFNNHHAIFDTTLCGDWAGAVWSGSGIPGQEQSCAQRTGAPTCEAFVRTNGAAFKEAYWEVKSVKIYQNQG